jgi:hypothetical protein
MTDNNKELGYSKESPVILEGVNNEIDGVDAEYAYLEKNFGVRNQNWKLDHQSLMKDGERYFDILDITLTNGEKKKIYFDITNFFGKGLDLPEKFK